MILPEKGSLNIGNLKIESVLNLKFFVLFHSLLATFFQLQQKVRSRTIQVYGDPMYAICRTLFSINLPKVY